MLIDLSYLRYPLPPDVQRLFEAGEFTRMERVITKRLADPRTPETLKKRMLFQLAVSQQIPRDYPHTRAALLEQLQNCIADFTAEEFEDLRDDGTLDWRYVEGEVRFKSNAVNNLCKTRKEYTHRIIDRESVARTQKEREELDALIARMKDKGHMRARFTMHEEITVDSVKLLSGETIRVHLPLPIVGNQVVSAKLLKTSHTPVSIAPEDHTARTAFFELPYQPGMTVSADFEFEVDAPYVNPDPAGVSAMQPDFCTGEEAPHVVFTPYIRALVKEIVGDERNPLIKARKIYDFITTQCLYRFMPAYTTVSNIPEYFLSGQRGDCGVQAITFVTLCRCAGIPAMWQAGIYARPGDVGNHDWAMFYVAPYGWLYCDCSFGGSAFQAGNEVRRDFYFANLEPWRLPLCYGFQQAFDGPRKYLRFDPYDNQNGEVETLNRRLERREYSVDADLISYEEL